MRRFLCGIAVACALACGDGQVTKYTGSAMNDAVPDSAGSLRLTFYGRTDTSFSGILELGAPLSGGGAAYAWHDGTDLKIVTVGATSADTIVWRSGSTGANLGGRFEITGGPHEGQGGTWRARLANGPPASPATLREPRRFPLPPLMSLWPLLVVGWAIAAATRWTRAAPVAPATGDDSGTLSAADRPLPRISGWLSLFLFGQCIALLVALASLVKLPASVRDGFKLGAVVVALRPLLVLESAMYVLLPVSIVIGIVLIVRRDRHAPRFWFAYLVLSAVYLVVDLVIGEYLNAQLTVLLGSGYTDAPSVRGSSTMAMLRQILFTVAWALYWARSERVRATFGAAALDRTARPVMQPEVAVVAAVPAPRRRRRWALRIAGAVAGAVAVLAGLSAWAGRVHPYVLPAGTDIRTAVAGRWDWTTRAAPCGDSAHVIAFPDGKVMTIAQQNRWVDSLGRDRTTTTYDIQSVTSSAIRGAIRGEERMTPDGRPVVWDLVLVGPDEYRWRRTDWSSPWGYTRAIVRCDARAPRRAAPAS